MVCSGMIFLLPMFLLHMAGCFTAAGVPSSTCEGGACSDPEVSNLLQVPRGQDRHAIMHRSHQRGGQSMSALTVSGAGWLSVASFSSFLSGLLNVSSKDGKIQYVDDLMKDYHVLSTCSGGTWFTLQLIYSNKFNMMIQSMAGAPDKVGEIFNTEWMMPMLWGTSESNQTVSLLQRRDIRPEASNTQKTLRQPLLDTREDLKFLENHSIGVEKTFHLLEEASIKFVDRLTSGLSAAAKTKLPSLGHIFQFLLLFFHAFKLDASIHLDWRDMVAWMFRETAGITSNETLMSAEPLSWANRKIILAGTAIATDPAGVSISERYTYKTMPGKQTPNNTVKNYTPAFVSYDMGTQKLSSELPFCAAGMDCGDLRMNYCESPNCGDLRQAGLTLSEITFNAFDLYTGRLTVTDVAAIATDLIAYTFNTLSPGTPEARALGFVFDELGLNFVQWVAAGEGHDALVAGDALWAKANTLEDEVDADLQTEALRLIQGPADGGLANGTAEQVQLIPELAYGSLFAMGDGGWSQDVTGIKAALSAGATEITSWVLFFNPKDPAADFTHLFGNATNYTSTDEPIFGGSCTPTMVNNKISEPDFKVNAAKGSTYFEGIVFFTLPDCVTLKDPWWNVEEGRHVSIKVAGIELGGLTTGVYTNFWTYSKAMQEMADALVDPNNLEAVKKFLEM